MRKIYLSNEKNRNAFRPARWSARNPGFLLIIIGWDESGKAILQVNIAVFGAVSKDFFGKDGSAHPRNKKAELPQRWPRDAPYMGALKIFAKIL